MESLETDKQELLIGVISDTHVPSRTSEIPKSIIDDFKRNNVDYVFHLGDFTTLEAYNQLVDEFGENKVYAIQGNMDSNEIRTKLPEQRSLEIFGHKILMTHGMGGPNMIIRRLNKKMNLEPYDIVLFGHVHRPYNETWKHGRLYLNPGTPTDKKFTDINSYAFLKISRDKVDFDVKEI
ncbi:MAG: Phosphoesterase [Promethearchaeota archaeon]|nr:MAG: Phosphoesterase [Candidatus Lokiarchaeota archaeon]